MPNELNMDEIDSVTKLWIHENIIEDQTEQFEMLKSLSYLLGSFTNPEAVNNLLNKEKNTVSSSKENFENTLSEIRNEALKELDKKPLKKKKKKIIK